MKGQMNYLDFNVIMGCMRAGMYVKGGNITGNSNTSALDEIRNETICVDMKPPIRFRFTTKEKKIHIERKSIKPSTTSQRKAQGYYATFIKHKAKEKDSDINQSIFKIVPEFLKKQDSTINNNS
ncbi:hypothetical protein TNCT_123851 [Trichonephila clavata]|uniref:Uncharacterized protein n=1 Tax=Trichonephila clavata TaxID=2740835 RepID=A0A8X6FAK3_TRICU|nr:hypothetical protein TNCT_123851 [Trichonephila clavata]